MIVNYFIAGNKLVMVIFTMNIICGKENSTILTDSEQYFNLLFFIFNAFPFLATNLKKCDSL